MMLKNAGPSAVDDFAIRLHNLCRYALIHVSMARAETKVCPLRSVALQNNFL
jgi:hypothetical protein